MQSAYQPEDKCQILVRASFHGKLNLETFLKRMAEIKIDVKAWQAFMSQYPDESLYTLFLNAKIDQLHESTCYHPAGFNLNQMVFEDAQKKFEALLNSHILMPEQDRAYLFCLLEIYIRIRNKEPESSSVYFGLYLSQGKSKLERVGHAQLYKEFICDTDYELNNFDQFLEKKGISHNKDTILQSRLGKIHDLAKKRGDDLAHEREQEFLQAPLVRKSI